MQYVSNLLLKITVFLEGAWSETRTIAFATLIVGVNTLYTAFDNHPSSYVINRLIGIIPYEMPHTMVWLYGFICVVSAIALFAIHTRRSMYIFVFSIPFWFYISLTYSLYQNVSIDIVVRDSIAFGVVLKNYIGLIHKMVEEASSVWSISNASR